MNKIPENKDEVLRYLGYRNQDLDKITDDLIDECMEEMRNSIKEKHIYGFFDIRRENGHVCLDKTNLILPGNDIKNHLERSEGCVLMAVTLGNNVDSKIRYYQRKSITKALILDACATAAVEEICDRVCDELEEAVNRENKTLTARYSPGYGDLPIDIQNDFLSVLGAQKAIGLTANSHSILIPRKSVTAIAGIIDIQNKQGRCGGPRPPVNDAEDGPAFKNCGCLQLPESENNPGCRDGPSPSENNTCLNCKNYSTCIFRRK